MSPLAGPFCAFLSSCTWAIGSTSYSKLSRDHRPVDVNFTRAVFALPCFMIAVFLIHGLGGGIDAFRVLESRHFAWFALSIVSSYGVGDVLFLLSTISLGVPGALAIGSAYPILTTLGGILFAGQTVHAQQWAGLALAIAGIVTVILNDPKGAPKGGAEVVSHPALRRKAVGVSLAIATAFCWATNGFAVSRGGADLDPAVGNTIRMAMGLGVIMVLSLATSRKPARVVDRATCRRYAWIFFIEGFLGSYTFVYGLSHSSLVLGATLSSLAPVLAVPVSVALKLERFSWVRSAAVATVVVGLSLLFR
jgi:drug/metabolite transporter (DMT)-like permease